MSEHELRAVIFDLDGTLADRRGSITRYAMRFKEDFAVELEHDFEAIVQVLIAADGHGYRAQQRPGDVAAALLQPHRAAAFDKHWRTHFPAMAVAYPNAQLLLEVLRGKGLRLGLVTNGSVAAQTTKLDKLGLTNAFDSVVISDAVKCKKPDPSIFAIALEELDVKPAETWFVGDHPVNDVAGAEAVGMRGFLVPGGPDWPADVVPCGTELRSLRGLLSELPETLSQ